LALVWAYRYTYNSGRATGSVFSWLKRGDPTDFDGAYKLVSRRPVVVRDTLHSRFKRDLALEENVFDLPTARE